MKISIIVLNYNGLADTLECLESISMLNKNGLKVEVVVVDNNSSDGSKKTLTKLKNIHLISNSRNLGFSGGNNKGIEYALSIKSNLILLLNNDTILDKNLLLGLSKTAKSFDIISPKIYFAKGHEFHKNRYKTKEIGKVIWYAGAKIDWNNILGSHIGVDEVDRGQYQKQHDTDFATGACMLIKKEVFEKIGLLDEKYFLYLEDMDFCVRAKKSNFKIGYDPIAFLWHKNAASTGGSGSDLQDYYITRSRLLFVFKFGKIRTKLAVLRESLSSSDKMKKKALFSFITANFGEYK